MLTWAGLVATIAVLVLLAAVAAREVLHLRADLRHALIDEAARHESASDLGIWEHELSAPDVADLE